MTATYYILQPDGTQTGPVPQAQVMAYLRSGVLRRESLVRRADLAEFFAVESYPEFTQAVTAPAPSAVVRGPAKSGVVRPGVGRPSARKPEAAGGGPLLWGMLVFLLVLLIWGGKVGWDKWQESADAKRAAAAEKWKSENLPEYRVVNLNKKFGLRAGDDIEVVIEGEVEEKEAKRHPEYGRAERHEVYVRLWLKTDFGELNTVNFGTETVIIRDGKGEFRVGKYVPAETAADVFAGGDRIKPDARIRYEK